MEERADEMLSDLIAFMGEVIIGLSEKNQLDLANQGGLMTELLEAAQYKIGRGDIRTIQVKKSLCKDLASFLGSSDDYFLTVEDQKALFVVETMKKKLTKLEALLNGSWNSNLSSIDADVQAILKEKKEKSSNNQDSDMVIEDGSGGPFFHKFSPLKDVQYECSECGTKLKNFSSYKRHMTSFHKGSKVISEEIKGHCLLKSKRDPSKLCLQAVSKRNFTRHLKDIHTIEVPKEKAVRGFFSDDGKTWEPVILGHKEKDPDYPDYEIEYGEDKEIKALKLVKSSSTETKRDLNQVKEVEQVKDASNNKETTESNNKVEQDKNLDVEIEAEDNSQKDEKVEGQEPNIDPPPDVIEENVGNRDKDWSPSPADVRTADPQTPKKPELDHELAVEEEVTHTLDLDVSSAAGGKVLTAEEAFEAASTLRSVSVDQLADEFYDGDDDQDSEVEEGDSQEFTARRIKSKEERYKKRREIDPEEVPAQLKPENAVVIEKFRKSLQNDKFDNPNKKSTTISNSILYLFEAKDSMLQWEIKKDPNFNLSQHLDFSKEVSSPIDRLNEMGGVDGLKNPIRRKENLKAEARYRSFISSEIENSSSFGTSLEGLTRRSFLLKNLEAVDAKISKSKLSARLDKLINKEKLEKDKALLVLSPSKHHLEKRAVAMWFSSEKWTELKERHAAVADKAMKTGKIDKQLFTDYGIFARFILSITDKQRAGTYSFKNEDYIMKQPFWIDEAGDYDKMLESADIHQPPSDDPQKEPTGFVMKISGNQSGLKGQKGVPITITSVAVELLSNYRSLKEILFGTIGDSDKPFFVNGNGEALAAIRNTRGSLYSIFSEVTGVRLTPTSLRKGIEEEVSASPSLAGHSEMITGHSKSTGAAVYNKTGADVRVSYVGLKTREEIGSSEMAEEDEQVLAKKRKIAQDDEKAKVEIAKKRLKESKESRNVTIGKKIFMEPQDRSFVQQVFSDKKYKAITNMEKGQKFPADRVWPHYFYRLVDGMEESDLKEELRSIEMKTFKLARKEFEEKAVWRGTASDQKASDKRVALMIKQSLKNYEKNRNVMFEDPIFKF